MIKAVRCDHSSFKAVRFEAGFNVVLAERTKESNPKDSRNGLGKTTLIEIIHFCFGAGTKPDEGLRVKELDDWTFMLDLTLRGKDYTIYRNTKDFKKVKIEGDISSWPIKPDYDIYEKRFSMKTAEWNSLLGYLMFDLPAEASGEQYKPTFRSLISYFARRGVGAFHDPFKHYAQQKEFDMQVNNAYLLGLNCEYAAEFQLLKDKEHTLQELKKAANQGLLVGLIGTLGDMEAERVRLEDEVSAAEDQLKTFKVHPQYYSIYEEAEALHKMIQGIKNKYAINAHILSKYEESITEERDASADSVKQIYEQAGLIFPEGVVKKIYDTLEFHKTIVRNRKEYLKSEIARIRSEIDEQKYQIENNSNKRAALLGILKTHGALEEYSKLQNRVVELRQQLEEVKGRIKNLEAFEEGKSVLKIEKEELIQKTHRDYQERQMQLDNARKFFNKNSENLYSEPGTLSIDIKDTGYKYKVEIKRAKSQGIGYMKVFCYDLTLTQLRAAHADMPGFLIHDSTIFDGVDERQIAKALELAASEAQSKGFQYICTLNSDIIPFNDFSDKFRNEFDRFVCIKLTDATEDGGILGVRF
ncbi:MAG: DUF2326 domain-containing protein [Nitrospirae bacterium]|nr:DUF2326 domain-containing protein [Nitrospirota bacterium]